MKVNELFPREQYGEMSDDIACAEIKSVTADSRKAGEESVFVCIKGALSDGHDFARSAYDRGCRMFVCERPLDLPSDANTVLVPNSRRALAGLVFRFKNVPDRSMKLIGITGTKGKSTVAEFIYRILLGAGKKAAVIGTCGVRFDGIDRPTLNTTPAAPELSELFAEMRDHGIEYVVMEVSSQAYKLDRVYGLHFDYAVFTNLYEDHIGPNEHPDFEDYMRCKSKLFDSSDECIVNVDSIYAENITGQVNEEKRFGYGFSSGAEKRGAEYIARRIRRFSENDIHGVEFECMGERFRVKMPGDFSVYNALASIAVCDRIGIPSEVIAAELEKISVKGRFETISQDGRSFVIDYAHNGASLESALSVLREYTEGRLIVLFGSIGGRAQLRRAEMARAAERFADLAIVTSDNPDREDPAAIVREIASHIKKCPVVTITDRAEAIRYAAREAKRGDIVLLAGKGHETYQLINGEKVPFSETEILKKELSAIYDPV